METLKISSDESDDDQLEFVREKEDSNIESNFGAFNPFKNGKENRAPVRGDSFFVRRGEKK